MKPTFVLLVAFRAAFAGAFPDGLQLHHASELSARQTTADAGSLTVTDPRFGDVVFRGTAESIYHEMAALKPELFDNEGILVPRDGSGTAPSPSDGISLNKRQEGRIDCGWPDKVWQYSHCWEGMDYLKRLGTAMCGVKPPYDNCSRVSCSHGCGIFLCNRTHQEYRKWCVHVYDDVVAMAHEDDCHFPTGKFGGARFWSNNVVIVRHDVC